MAPEQVLHYRIERKLGEGGTAEVYLAHDTRLDRRVALKFLPSDASGQASHSLLVEARAASRLNHPNILTVYAVEESERGTFLVTEFVPGRDLRSWMADGPHTLAALLKVAAQVAQGLAAAHEAGVVHRDVKPENIHLGDDGRVRLLDFGVASQRTEGARLPSTERRGTAPYMSPEQILGRPVEPSSDVFSLGVMLYELVSGARPFTGDYEPAVLYGIIYSDPQDPRERGAQCSEELWRLLSACLAKTGAERPAASRVARELSALALGTEPSPVHQERLPARPGVPLVGRETQKLDLLRRLGEAVKGRGQAVFVSGEAGIGKSRLLEELAAEARAGGMSVFSGWGLPRGGGMPYHPITSALKKNFQRLDVRVLDGLSDSARESGIDLAPRLPALRTFLQLEAGDASLLNREQLWDAVRILLAALSRERPLLFVLDDLHWSDQATLDLLAYLVRNLSELRVLLVAAWRTGEATAHAEGADAVEQLVRQLRMDRSAETIRLGRLTLQESLELARALAAPGMDPSVLEKLVQSADGNPLFLGELASWMKHQTAEDTAAQALRSTPTLPERVRDVIGARLERLDSADHDLLALASCEPVDFGSAALAEGLGKGRLEILQRLAELERRHGVIRHDGLRYRFDHPLFKQVLYEGLLPELRQEFHRMLALHLAGRPEDATHDAWRVAHHMLAGGLKAQALPHLLSAGQKALQVFAIEEARQYFGRALDLSGAGVSLDHATQVNLWLGLGEASASSGDSARAVDCFKRLSELAEPTQDGRLKAEAHRKWALQLVIRGELDEALRRARWAVEQSTPGTPEHIAALQALAHVHASRSEYARAIEAASQARELAEEHGDRASGSVSLSLLGTSHLHMGQAVTAAGLLERAVTWQRELGDRRGLANALNFRSLALGQTGELVRALECQLESLDIKEKIGEVRAVPGSLNGIGDLYRDLGDVQQARAYHLRSLELAREFGNVGSECDNLRDLGADHLLLGEWETGAEYLQAALRLSRERGFTWYETRACTSLVEWHLQHGNLDQAREYAERALLLAERLGTRELLANAQRGLARLEASRGDLGSARTRLRAATTMARDGGLRLALLRLLGETIRLLPADDAEVTSARSEAASLLDSLRRQFEDPAALARFDASEAVRSVTLK